MSTGAAGPALEGRVVSVSRDDVHRFSKIVVPEIHCLAGLGVEGDAHCGATVKHRSRVAVDPTQPNLRQVHLVAEELFAELWRAGHPVAPAALGENVTTRGIDLLALPRGTLLGLGAAVVLEVTGLRNPCKQIDDYQPGLLARVLDREPDGRLIRKAGIMTVVRTGGPVRAGDRVAVTLPPPPHEALERV